MGAAAKSFDYNNGDYNTELIIGDAALSNSFQWTLAVVSLKFPEPSASGIAEESIHSQKSNAHSPKPEIRVRFKGKYML